LGVMGGDSHRRICLAVSEDGVQWTKPILGIFNRTDPKTNATSTLNNILLEDSGVSVFLDHAPNVPESQRWKMISSYYAYMSADGLHWTKMSGKAATSDADDTKPTAFYDPHLGKYVVYVRRDLEPGYVRAIGRCLTDDLTNWEKEMPAGQHCPTVFLPDELDPASGFDVYTNSWTPYPSIEKPAVHLFFPSMYFHFGSNPWGHGNDGLLDIRMLVSRDGASLGYVQNASNARSAYVALGDNSCGAGLGSRPEVHGGWCNEFSGELAYTATDTSAMYMASGFLFSSDGGSVLQYSSAQSLTHGGDGSTQTWGANTGIRLLSTRRDGFTFVEAPYLMRTNITDLPALTTAPVPIPSACQSGAVLRINMQTGVAGIVATEVQDANGTALKGYTLTESDPVKGSNLGAIPTWSQGQTVKLPNGLASVRVKLAMTDAKLFSVRTSCFSGAPPRASSVHQVSAYV